MSQQQYEKKIQCLCNQLEEYAKQIDTIQDELERTRNKLSACSREQDDLKRQISGKDDAIACYESKLEEIKFELKEKEKNSQRLVECLQEKVCCFHEQLQQKESALLMCRNEVKCHLATLDEIKTNFSCEIQQREMCVTQMKEDLRRVYEDLKCKSEENCQLDRTVVDLKSRLNQSCCQLKEAETRIDCLQGKIQQVDSQNNKDKAQAQQDVEEFEKKLSSCCQELCVIQGDNRKLKRCVCEKEEEIQTVLAERSCLARELDNEKRESASQAERADNLENDNKEICRLLQQKVKCIKELEDALCLKEEELQQCQCCVDELNQRLRESNTGISHTADDGGGGKDLETELRECRDKLKKALADLEDCRSKLEWAVQEMENMAKEIKRLNCELDSAKKEICEKKSMIGDLERTIEHAEQDMEARMRRVDDQLQKYEREIKDKTHMIGECEEKCCRYQHSLADKDSELDTMDQRLKRATCEIQSLSCKTKELEEARDVYQRQFSDQRAQFIELSQEYKLTREQFQCASGELEENKRSLGCCQREFERVRREADDIRCCLQEKESACYRLTEEKNCLNGKLNSLQCRFENETTQLTQQMTDMRHRLEKEVEQLRHCQLELEDTNASLVQKVTLGQRQLAQLEKCYYQKVDTLNRENDTLKTKLQDKDDQLQASKDCITLRDSEIMRLKLRMCSLDRCNNSDACDGPGNGCRPRPGSALMAVTTGVKTRKRSSSCGPQATCCGQWRDVATRREEKERQSCESSGQ